MFVYNDFEREIKNANAMNITTIAESLFHSPWGWGYSSEGTRSDSLNECKDSIAAGVSQFRNLKNSKRIHPKSPEHFDPNNQSDANLAFFFNKILPVIAPTPEKIEALVVGIREKLEREDDNSISIGTTRVPAKSDPLYGKWEKSYIRYAGTKPYDEQKSDLLLETGKNFIFKSFLFVVRWTNAFVDFSRPGEPDSDDNEKAQQDDISEELIREESKRNERILLKLGITKLLNQIDGSGYEAKECIKEVQDSLRFMGTAGSKWLNDMTAFEKMLKRVRMKRHKVRFLLIDPQGEGFSSLENPPELDVYKKWLELTRKHPKDYFEVKLYNDYLSFRLQIVDERYVVVSKYESEEVVDDCKPTMVIYKSGKLPDGTNPHTHSLYESFKNIFDSKWDDDKGSRDKVSRDIAELEDYLKGK